VKRTLESVEKWGFESKSLCLEIDQLFRLAGRLPSGAYIASCSKGMIPCLVLKTCMNKFQPVEGWS